MGGAKRYASTPVRVAMGIAALHPSYDRRTIAISRRIPPELCIFFCPLRKLRAQGRPGACCTRGPACDLRKQMCTRAYRAARTLRPSLRNGFTAYFVLSPENGSFASVAREKLSLLPDLAPAPRRPNHTTSPYASGAHVCRTLSVHRIPPRVRDVRERPSSAVRQAELCD
jgi:hypothetical protein